MAAAVACVHRSAVCSAYDITIDDGDMNKWVVGFPKETFIPEHAPLYHDLDAWSARAKQAAAVVLELTFPTDYPRLPPFVRVVRPRFKFHTGHVTVGGSICTPLLTMDAWRSDISGEALLLTLHSTLVEGNARVERHIVVDYAEREAREAFVRVARDHGWSV